MVKSPAIHRLSPICHFWHFWCDFCNFCVFLACILYFLSAFFFFCSFNTEDFWYAFFFDLFFCVHFLQMFLSNKRFLLPPIVEVEVSDIAIISVIPDMVKAIISGITNTPQKTYCIAQQILGIGHKP